MKHLNLSQMVLSLLGMMFGVIIMGLTFVTISSVIASPIDPPPDGNPTYPSQGPEGPQGAPGANAIGTFRLVKQAFTGNQFAEGVSISCAANEYLVDCSHTCNKGSDDTQSWPINNTTCQGHEASDKGHSGQCILIAHCLKHN